MKTLALTVKSTIDFLKPVKAGDRVIARAEVKKESNMENRTLVEDDFQGRGCSCIYRPILHVPDNGA